MEERYYREDMEFFRKMGYTLKARVSPESQYYSNRQELHDVPSPAPASVCFFIEQGVADDGRKFGKQAEVRLDRVQNGVAWYK